MNLDIHPSPAASAVIRAQEKHLRTSHAHRWKTRTDALVGQLGISSNELQRRLGISKEMYYGYRSGKYPISQKAWAKLQNVETAVVQPPREPVTSIPPYLLSLALSLMCAGMTYATLHHLATHPQGPAHGWLALLAAIMGVQAIIYSLQTLFLATPQKSR